MLEFLPYVFIGGLGLAVGSFLNVVIFRFGFGESGQKRSHCMACDAVLHPSDLVPVFSYLLLWGRCRACGSGLSIQYPLVEVLTSALFVLSYGFFTPQETVMGYAAFGALLFFLATLMALTVYDLRHTIVPMPFLYALIGSALTASILQSCIAGSIFPFLDSLLGGVALAAFFFGIFVLTKGRGMGSGDAYVAGAVGIMLGFSRGIEAVMLAFWIGTAVCVPLYLLSSKRREASFGGSSGSSLPKKGASQSGLLSSFLKKRRLFGLMPRVTITTELPFVPFLALGVILALFTSLSPLSFGTWLSAILMPIEI